MRSLVIILFLCGFALESSVFQGRVIDQNGQPVREATIAILGEIGATQTDDDGWFTWSPSPATPFEVLVVLSTGVYMSPVLVEEVPVNRQLEIVIRPLMSESVVVSGGAAPNIDATPASGTMVIPKEDIVSRQPTSFSAVLENVAGVGNVSDLHNSVPSLRGLARGRTLLLIDGARVTTERRAGPSASFLDPFFLESVEVARGPGSVGYGSDAIGGIIYARTRRVEPGAPTRIRVRGVGSAGLPEIAGGVELSHGLDRGGFLFQARYRKFDSYRSPLGKVFNSQSSGRGVLGRFSYAVGPGQLNLGFQTDINTDTGRPDSRGRRVVTSYPEERSRRITMDYDLKPSLGFTRLGFQAFLGRYQLMTSRTMQSAPGVSKSKATSDVSAGDFSFRSFAVRPLFTGRFEIGVDVNGRYGLRSSNLFLEFNDEENVIKRLEDVSIADASRSDVGVYSNSQWKLNPALTLGLGGRFDRITTRNEGGLFGEYATNNSALSGYGSVSVEMLRGLSLTGQLSRSFRDPMLSDRYYYGISGRGIVMGNPDLSPERANQFDTALRFTYARIRGAIYGYIYRLSNLIERFEIKPDEFYFRNQGVGDIRGLELELQTTLGNDFRVDFTTQISRGVTVGSAQYLDDIPTRDFKIVVRRELSERGYAILRFANFGMDAKPGPTEIVVPGYTTLDMGAGWKMSEKIELRGTIRNLLDQAYLITPDRRAVFAPGISGGFTVVAEF